MDFKCLFDHRMWSYGSFSIYLDRSLIEIAAWKRCQHGWRVARASIWPVVGWCQMTSSWVVPIRAFIWLVVGWCQMSGVVGSKEKIWADGDSNVNQIKSHKINVTVSVLGWKPHQQASREMKVAFLSVHPTETCLLWVVRHAQMQPLQMARGPCRPWGSRKTSSWQFIIQEWRSWIDNNIK